MFAMTYSLKFESLIIYHILVSCRYFKDLNIPKNMRKILDRFNWSIFIIFCELAKLWLIKKGKT